MSGVHKNPTISFRISDREREEIEAKIIVSGLNKKVYFVRSCIYNHVCVVGKKELIYKLVRELRMMMETLQKATKQFEQSEVFLSKDGLEDRRLEYLNLLKATDLDARRSQIFMAGQQRKCPYKRVRTLVVTKAEPLIPYLANTSIAKASARNNHKFERGAFHGRSKTDK